MRPWLLVVTADVETGRGRGFVFKISVIFQSVSILYFLCVSELMSPAGFINRTLNVEACLNPVRSSYSSEPTDPSGRHYLI